MSWALFNVCRCELATVIYYNYLKHFLILFITVFYHTIKAADLHDNLSMLCNIYQCPFYISGSKLLYIYLSKL